MNDPATVEFFTGDKVAAILFETPKMDKKKTSITLGFSTPLTAEAIKNAPKSVTEAFYTVQKEGLNLNPVGIDMEFQDVVATFYSTKQTKAPTLEVSGGKIKKLEVMRPEHKDVLDDGDVRLTYRLILPASQEIWKWGYSNFKSEVAVMFEELQPLLPVIKAANPDSDGQGILSMEKSDAEPTVVDSAADNPQPEPSKKKKSSSKKKKK